MPLTPKQKAFADYYLECGNATEAAERAGYKGNRVTLSAVGTENLRKPLISEYIAKRMAPKEAERIASADEVLQFYSDVMRGKVKDQFGLDAALTDRLNAGKELMKRHAAAGNITIGTQKPEDDALTKSLRELAEELMEERHDG